MSDMPVDFKIFIVLGVGEVGRMKTTFHSLFWSKGFWLGSCQCKTFMQTWKAERRRRIPALVFARQQIGTDYLQGLPGELLGTLTSVWHAGESIGQDFLWSKSFLISSKPTGILSGLHSPALSLINSVLTPFLLKYLERFLFSWLKPDW